jgi:O-antigen ligase
MRRLAELSVVVVLATACVYMLPTVGAIGLGILGVVTLIRAPRRWPLLTTLVVVTFIAWGLLMLVGEKATHEMLGQGGLTSQLQGFLCYLPLFGMTLLHLTPGDRRLWMYFRSLSIPAAAIALAGLVQLATGIDVAHSSDAYSPSPIQSALGNRVFTSLAQSHTAAAGVYATVAALTAAVFVFTRTSRYRTLLTLTTLALVVWGLMFAKSGAFIGAFCLAYLVICVFLGLRFVRGGVFGLRDTRILRALTVLAIAVVIYSNTAGLHDQVTGGTEGADGDSRAPGSYLAAGWRMFTSNPIFGVGIGNYARELVASDTPREAPRRRSKEAHASSSYVHLLAEMGIIGFLPFLGLIGLVSYRLFRAASNPGLSEMSRAVAIGALAAFAGQLGAAAVDHTLWSPQIMVPATTLTGLALGVGNVPGEGGAPEASGSEGDAKA